MIAQRRPKPKKCRECRKEFQPTRAIQPCCENFECKAAYAIKVAERAKAKREAKERKELRAAKEAIKPRSKVLKEAQMAFNKYRRLACAGEPCISCGRPEQEVENTESWKPGGAWDCGHFLSVGSHPELRFEELNAHRQCKSCNGGSGNFAAKNYKVFVQYEINLRKKIGDEKVDWLKGPHDPKHYSIDDLKEIKAKYSRMERELSNAELSGPRPLAAEGSRSNAGLGAGGDKE